MIAKILDWINWNLAGFRDPSFFINPETYFDDVA